MVLCEPAPLGSQMAQHLLQRLVETRVARAGDQPEERRPGEAPEGRQPLNAVLPDVLKQWDWVGNAQPVLYELA